MSAQLTLILLSGIAALEVLKNRHVIREREMPISAEDSDSVINS